MHIRGFHLKCLDKANPSPILWRMSVLIGTKSVKKALKSKAYLNRPPILSSTTKEKRHLLYITALDQFTGALLA